MDDLRGQEICVDYLKGQGTEKPGSIYQRSQRIDELRGRGIYLNNFSEQGGYIFDLKVQGVFIEKSNPESLYKLPGGQVEQTSQTIASPSTKK